MSFQVEQDANRLESDLLSPVVSFGPRNFEVGERSLINCSLWKLDTFVLFQAYCSRQWNGIVVFMEMRNMHQFSRWRVTLTPALSPRERGSVARHSKVQGVVHTEYFSTESGFSSSPSPGLSGNGDHMPSLCSGNSVYQMRSASCATFKYSTTFRLGVAQHI